MPRAAATGERNTKDMSPRPLQGVSAVGRWSADSGQKQRTRLSTLTPPSAKNTCRTPFENCALRSALPTTFGLRRRRVCTIWNARADNPGSHCLRVPSLCGRSVSLLSVKSPPVGFDKSIGFPESRRIRFRKLFRLSSEFETAFDPIFNKPRTLIKPVGSRRLVYLLLGCTRRSRRRSLKFENYIPTP